MRKYLELEMERIDLRISAVIRARAFTKEFSGFASSA